jgi:hypothetical protein
MKTFAKTTTQSGTRQFLKRLAALPLWLIAGSVLAADQEVRPLNDAISKINSRSEFNITIRRGSTASVVLSGDKDKFTRVKTEQRGDTLFIGRDGSNWNSLARIEIVINLPTLHEAAFNGSGSGVIEGFKGAPGDRFKLGVNASGSVVLDGQAVDTTIEMNGSGSLVATLHAMQSLHLKQTGSGSANLNGDAEKAELILNGSGSLEAGKLIVGKLKVLLGGSGSMNVFAKDSADVSSSGSGSVHVYGAPRERKSNAGGSGKLVWH